MAVLEKIRVKMGAFITVLIGVALLSFIIDPDTLQSAISVFSSKYDVGEMNGKSVSYQDYQKKVDYFTQIYQLTSGNASGDQVQDMINNTAWQDEITRNVLIPSILGAGIGVGTEELLDMSQGKNISPILANEVSFQNENGEFDRAKLVQFVQMIPQDESGQMRMYWDYLENNMYNDQLFGKYLSVLAKSNILTPAELKRVVAENNTTYDVDYVVKPFGFGIDSSLTVSNQEAKKYYDEHKELYRQSESRDLQYVVYEIVPSAEDIRFTEEAINKVYDEFRTTSNMKSFLARNSDQQYNPYYFSKDELSAFPAGIAEFAGTGKKDDVLAPAREENAYVAARIMDVRSMPDSVFVKHILLQGDDAAKADSLMAELKKGASFAQLAQQYSADKNPNAAEPGDLGWMTQSYMIPGFESVMTAPKGEVRKLNTTYGTHLVLVTDRTKPVEKIQVAVLAKEAIAGKQTYSDYYAKANDLVSKSEGQLDKFNAAVKELNLNSYPAVRVVPGAKSIANYGKAKEVIRWAFENDPGSVSPILTVDNKYFFVVAITGVHEEGYATFDEVAPQIKTLLALEKKGEKMASEAKASVGTASDLEQIAEKLGTTVSHQSGVSFGSRTSQALDPMLVGAIAGAEEGKVTGPVIGEVGVYYFKVIGKSEGAFFTEADAKMQNDQDLIYLSRVLPVVMTQDAQIKDYRYKFY